MSIVTFRISKRLKDRMNRLRHVNWSGLLREAVERSVEEEERRLAPQRDARRMKDACEEMDRLAKLTEGSGWSGAEEVIKWRRLRYSSLTQA